MESDFKARLRFPSFPAAAAAAAGGLHPSVECSCVYVFVVVHVTFSVVHARCSSTCAEAHDVMLASALKDYLTHMFTAFPPTAWTGDPALTIRCCIMSMGCIARITIWRDARIVLTVGHGS